MIEKNITIKLIFTAWACYRSKNCENGENVVAILINKLADVNEVLTKQGVTILQLGESFMFLIFLIVKLRKLIFHLRFNHHNFNKMQQKIYVL